MSHLPRYTPGQCWKSASEPELGLGKIIAADRKFVEVAFSGISCIRKYGASSAPLRRILFKVGDVIRDANGAELRITSVRDANADGKVTYVCGDAFVPEDAVIDSASGAPAPLQRLLSGIIDRCEDFTLRTKLLMMQAEIARSPVRGFCGGRVELMPHQLSIASEVSSRRSVRVLLADETGLGKTIEASLILHRMILTGRVRRCLICVPESLLHQWFIELMRRFNLSFRLFTKEHFDAVAGAANPFLNDQLGIISMGFLAHDNRLCDMAVSAGWDMVIVDEAHHLRPGGRDFDCVQRLSEKSESLILLTATPQQSGARDHFYRLLDRLGVGRVMFRNTRRTISGFPRRVVVIEPIHFDEPLKTAINDEYGGRVRGTAASFSPLSKDNPRVVWLINLLKARAAEKFLIICAVKEKAAAIRDAVQESIKVDIALFHEEMTLLQRDRNAAWFTEGNGARLLIASEIGSEGRNFQCCRNLVLFDLPLDPEVLEQRIGRLDRIGQGPVVFIFVPYAVDTHEETLCRWYHEGLGMLEKNVPVAGLAGDAVREMLTALLTSDQRDTHRQESLLRKTAQLCADFSKMLEKGGDQELEIVTFEQHQAERIKNAILQMEEKRLSAKVMEPLFKHYGVVTEDGGNGKRLLFTDYVTDHRFPLPRHERPLVTYDRETALIREDIEFLSIDHPMVIDALDLFLSSDCGTSVFAIGDVPGREEFLLESLYILECIAPDTINSTRFIPPTPIRVVVSKNGEDITEKFPSALLDQRCKDASPDMLETNAISLGDSIPPLLQKAEAFAALAARPIIDGSLAEMRKSLDAELGRLRSSRSTERLFLDREIELCGLEKEALEKHLKASRVRLDSIRVIWLGRV